MKNWAGNLTYAAYARPTAGLGRGGAGADRGRRSHSAARNAPLLQPRRRLRRRRCSRRSTSIASSRSATRRSPSRPAFATESSAPCSQEHGLALANLASLPHISVGGAIATGTHGSGVGNASLAAAVSALEIVGADGSIRRLRRGDDDFDGAVVGLGALGLVVRVSLDVVPAFELRQYVFEDLPGRAVDADLYEILAGGYSVSLFTSWTERGVDQVWVKTTESLAGQPSYFGATPADSPRNPVPGANWENCTEQLGSPGPSGERLPHFRLGFTPSSGAELQSEYVVAREHGARRRPRATPPRPDRLAAPARLGDPGGRRGHAVAEPVLRAGQHRVPLHLEAARRRGARRAAAGRSALPPFGARPHWGKLFAMSAEELEAVYPRLPAFRQASGEARPRGNFGNAFSRALRLSGRRRTSSGFGPSRPASPRSSPSIAATSARLELEVEELEVLPDPRRRHRLREDDVPALDVPAKDDLRRRFAEPARRSRPAPGRRAPCPARSAPRPRSRSRAPCRTRRPPGCGSTGAARPGSPPARRPSRRRGARDAQPGSSRRRSTAPGRPAGTPRASSRSTRSRRRRASAAASG